METCLRGFSFVPENKVEVIDLQYVEGSELSRAWKANRRQRMKDLEAKIWEQFVQERDIVQSVCSDDPYQFIDHLPEDCLNELMESELNSMKDGSPGRHEEQTQFVVPQEAVKQSDTPQEPRDTMVTFAEESEPETSEMIHIFDDDKDDDVSGPEEARDSTSPPCTVRAASPERDAQTDKQTEDVRNMLETSIYSAKVKELQSKVNLELLSVITTIEAQDLNKIDPQDLPKFQRQGTEFCARFNRIYLYQLKRQVQDIARHNSGALPFARHTLQRSQLLRAVSLQQNMLQALQVLHKWFTARPPLRECAASLAAWAGAARAAGLAGPAELRDHEMEQTCQNLDGVLALYSQRLDLYLNAEIASSSRSKKSSAKQVTKKKSGKWPKQATKMNADADGRLSMYSLDHPRTRARARKEPTAGSTSKARLGEQAASADKMAAVADVAQKKKTPRSRLPLMRAPGGHRGKREKPREPDNIHTMVEAVAMCASNDMSRENTPRNPESPLRSKNATPRERARARGARAHEPDLAPVDVVKADSDANLSPVIKVQCERRDPKPPSPPVSPRQSATEESSPTAREKKKSEKTTASCDVSRLLRSLCAGGSSSGDRATGAKNAQLLCVNGGSPRQPSTPQLLRILEETIQKQAPKPQYYAKPRPKDAECRLAFSVSPRAADALFAYRTKFVQHMLASPMYANSAIGKPWEMIGSVSEQILDEVLLACAKEMQLEGVVEELYKTETS